MGAAADGRRSSPPARCSGRAFHVVDGAHRRLALKNLEAAFPARPEAERAAIARDMFAHFGRLLTVLLKFSTMRPSRCWRASSSKARSACARRTRSARACCSSPGHFGYWEINALVHALALHPMSVLARPLDNPRLHELLEQVRGRTGNSVIYRRGAVRRVLRALAANQAVAVLIDQHIQTADAVYVDFFNRPAATTSALAALALRTGAPVIPGVRAAAARRPLPHGLRARGRSADAPIIPTRCATSRSAAPTCSRCTCAATRASGSGCTGAGATSSRPAGEARGMFPSAATRGMNVPRVPV